VTCAAAAFAFVALMAAPAGPAAAADPVTAGRHPSRTTQGVRPVITDIRVHGNLIVTNDEVLALIGVAPGDPLGPTTVADVTARLKASGKFEHVQVLERFASIDDPSRIALVVIVNEGPVRIAGGDGPLEVVRRRGVRNLLFLPIVEAEDGYGLTYGARLAFAGAAGGRSRISVPLTWGGRKQAAVELDRALAAGPFTRVQAGAGVQRRTNPAFDLDDARRELWGRLERAAGPVRAGATAGWSRVSFAGGVERFRSAGADVSVDTRVDPVLPRNAVFAMAKWERLSFSTGGTVDRHRLEGRGYLGLIGRAVLAARALHEGSDGPLPLYLKPILGGWANLRGFRAGTAAGDSLTAGSIELRLPLNSPLRIAKFGVSVFADAGTVYDYGERLRDHRLGRGYGAGVWLSATVVHVGVSVARGGGETRVNFGGGTSF
jgi:outer membrane protein assembly factor BamA